MIKYVENCKLELSQLVELYTNVGWIAYTKDPIKLEMAVNNSLFNIAAFDEHELIGLTRVVGDGISIIYIQDVLVKENYQRLGIGSHLLQQVLHKYNSVRQIVLMTDNTVKTNSFYEKNGMCSCTKYDGIAFVKYN